MTIIKQPQELQNEVDALEKAQELVTETGIPQTVEVDGENVQVTDENRAGREIKPVPIV
ncbi:MAG: hypothetical protein Q8Q30_02190 [Candidatus Woesebacteria bacterium]|nr:hypothetical protein [Candidatus Woesebacteria bacterium]